MDRLPAARDKALKIFGIVILLLPADGPAPTVSRRRICSSVVNVRILGVRRIT